MSDRITQQSKQHPRFTVRDLYVYDGEHALDWIRKREPEFFPGGLFTPAEAALHIARQVLESGAKHIAIEHRSGWWLVWSKQDWLRDSDSSEVFRRAVRNAHGGPN